MKQSIFTRGFTLIELLVVIAIIGILAAVVIGSLNDARSGGQDASIKQSVANVRAQAELWYNSNPVNQYSYANLCAQPSIINLLSAATDVVNGMPYVPGTHGVPGYSATNALTGPNTGRTASCRADDTRYLAVAPLAGINQFWCVDSTGASVQIATLPTPTTDFTCN